jgi:propionyl-CoA synthetase
VDKEFIMSRYAEAFRRSLTDPDGFWAEAARAIDWYQAPTAVLDRSKPPFYRWFPDGVLNTCFNALDRHVRDGRGGQAALIYDSPVTGTQRTYTYAELLDEVARFAGVLRGLGVDRGERVIVYMPMIPEAVIAMLACARIGAVHSVVFGGFAAAELATRIDDAAPKVVVSASCGIETSRIIEYKPILDRAIDLARNKPDRCVIMQRPAATATLNPGRDLDWSQALAGAEPADCVPVAATDPLYILYTSGTTARPKGVVRDNGGHAVALRWTMANIYDTGPGEVFWAASDVGWVVGHSYIVYAPLLTGCTTVLYEGKPVGTPDAGAFWRVIAEHKVKSMFTAPTAFRAIKKEDPEGKLLQEYDLSGFKILFLAGERLDPETYRWAGQLLGVPVVDHWWQTETGWAIAADPMGLEPLPTKAGSPTMPMPGYDVRILDADGTELKADETGEIVVKLPLPPGCLPTLWGDDDRYVTSYLSQHPGFYITGDGGYRDQDGYLYVMGRTDDVINVAGHRLSTGQMEEVLASHPAVAECAVIGVDDDFKGQIPRGFVVLKAGISTDPAVVSAELVQLVRDRIGPVAALRRVDVITALPKTRSGKILRKTMRGIADGQDEPVPSTIEDAAVLDALRPVLTDPGALLPWPAGLAAGGERGVELGVVLALHQQRLGHRLELDRGGQAHVLLPGEQRLGLRVGLGRPGGEPAREPAYGLLERVRVGQLGDQPDPERLVGADGVAEHQQPGRVPQPDQPGQQVGRAHVRAGQPDLGEQEREPGRRGAHAEVGGQRDHRAGPGRHAVHGRDDRHRAFAHEPDHLTGHPGEGQQLVRRHGQGDPDDLVDVPARAERPAAAPNDQDSHIAPLRELGEQVAQVGVRFEGERVELVRPVEGHGGHPVVQREAEVLPLAGQRGRSTERAHLGRSRYSDLLTAVTKGKYW